MLENPEILQIIFDSHGLIVQANKPFERLIGKSSGKVKSKYVWDLIYEQSEIKELKKIINKPNSINSSKKYKLTFYANNKKTVDINGFFQPLPKDEQFVKYIIFSGMIISDESNPSLKKRLNQIKKLEAVGLMAGGIAHDFNNVLTGIIGLTELSLRQLEVNHPITKYLRMILEKSDSAGNLVRKLMFFSKNTVNKFTKTDLNSLIKSTINFVHRYIGEDINFDLQLSPDLYTIYADHTAMEQIITNLIINSRDAMPDGGLITINTSNISQNEIPSGYDFIQNSDYYVRLTFKDSGIGMDGDIQQNIFKPFFTTKESERGTGLGLATVNDIVKEHKGFIKCNSALGEGTIFEFFFPASKEKFKPELESELNIPKEGNETLLVVEDDDHLLNSFKKTLENFGYKVLIAQNGRDALELFTRKANEINMIITDIVLPEMGGMDLYLLINKEYPDLHFLLMSGYSDKIESGINYIQKPFHSNELVNKIREILDNHSETGKKEAIN